MGGALIVLTLLLAIDPHDGAVNCGVVEVNHVYNCEGEIRLQQAVFWDFEGNVIDWRYLSDCPVPNGYRVDWTWREGNRWIRFAGRRVETHTLYDVEVEHREILPLAYRSGLR